MSLFSKFDFQGINDFQSLEISWNIKQCLLSIYTIYLLKTFHERKPFFFWKDFIQLLQLPLMRVSSFCGGENLPRKKLSLDVWEELLLVHKTEENVSAKRAERERRRKKTHSTHLQLPRFVVLVRKSSESLNLKIEFFHQKSFSSHCAEIYV